MSKHACDDAIARIYPYLDGEVTVLRRLLVRRHLRRCPPCDGAFAFEQRLKVVVRERTREEVPPEMLDRLRTYLGEAGAVD